MSTEGLTTTPPKELILVHEAQMSKPKIKPPEGLKMYSAHEIEAVDGYERKYRSFWNIKAQEILSNPDTRKVILGDVMAVRGAIDTAWATKKAELLQLDATKVLKIAEDYQDQLPKKDLCK